MTRTSSPSGAAPYSAASISLSVPSTPTRRTFTSTPRPPGTSVTDGFGRSTRCTLFGTPGVTAIAFMLAPCPMICWLSGPLDTSVPPRGSRRTREALPCHARPEPAGEDLPQGHPRAVQSRLHRGDGFTERLGRLLVRHLFDVPEHEHRAVMIR